MRRIFVLVALILVADAAQGQTDLNAWAVTGRVAYITETTFPDANTIVSVTLGNIDHELDGNFTRYVSFNCTYLSDCTYHILGTCTKQTNTATSSSAEGATTFKTTSCVNQHYADCWTFSGFMTPQLWSTAQYQSYGCNF